MSENKLTLEESVKYEYWKKNHPTHRRLDEIDYIYIFALAHHEGDISDENLSKNYKKVVLERDREGNKEREWNGNKLERIKFTYLTPDTSFLSHYDPEKEYQELIDREIAFQQEMKFFIERKEKETL